MTLVQLLLRFIASPATVCFALAVTVAVAAFFILRLLLFSLQLRALVCLVRASSSCSVVPPYDHFLLVDCSLLLPRFSTARSLHGFFACSAFLYFSSYVVCSCPLPFPAQASGASFASSNALKMRVFS